MTLKCMNCNVEIHFHNWGNVRDINNKAIRCCKNCAEEVLSNLMKERFVETCNNNDIYMFEDRYYPYWGCTYSFYTIEDCRTRIDMKGVAVVPTELLNRVRQGRSLL